MGTQHPTFSVHPDAADLSTADEAIELAATAGIMLLEWQAEQVRRALAQTDAQEWAATRWGLAVPRQNGKGVVLEVVVLAKLVLLGERVLWTCHEVRTTQEAFMRFRAVLDATPALARLVQNVRAANGQERIMFTNGGEVKFSARSKSATRGLGFRTILFDEAQELDYLTLGAAVPTLSGQSDNRTQQLYTGTPPYSAKGEVFTDLRTAAYTGGDERLSWSEWAADPDDRQDDPGVWAKTNPSLGTVVREEKIRDEAATLEARPDVFRRERLGEWGRSGDVRLALDEVQWAGGAVPVAAWGDRDEAYTHRTHGPARFLAVDCTFNADLTSVVEAVPLTGDRIGLQVLHADTGMDWLATWLAAQKEATPRLHVAYDPLRTGDLEPDLRTAGIRDANVGHNPKRILPASSRDLTHACDGLVRAVREGRVVHDDPRLDAAAGCATRSTYDDGKGWKFTGGSAGDVHVLIAAALALASLRGFRVGSGGRGRVILLD
jgi:hypothetical protein